MDKTLIRGRLWVLTDKAGRLIEDIDTDQIYHNAHLHVTELGPMGAHALGNLEGWKDFPKKARPGDILAAGRNFGAGSSRQQAVDCFIALGVAAVLAPSFSAIYFRNAVNSGFAAIRVPDLRRLAVEGYLKSEDKISVNLVTGEALDVTQGRGFLVEPMSAVQLAIYQAGDLFHYGAGPR